jgi:hypothetical protein
VDQVITTARLELNLKISPAMVARNATMQLMLNGQPLGTVPTVTDSDTARFTISAGYSLCADGVEQQPEL